VGAHLVIVSKRVSIELNTGQLEKIIEPQMAVFATHPRKLQQIHDSAQ